MYMLGPQKPDVKVAAVKMGLHAILGDSIPVSSFPSVPYPNNYGLLPAELAQLILTYVKL